jgi:hypothetical protein
VLLDGVSPSDVGAVLLGYQRSTTWLFRPEVAGQLDSSRQWIGAAGGGQRRSAWEIGAATGGRRRSARETARRARKWAATPAYFPREKLKMCCKVL